MEDLKSRIANINNYLIERLSNIFINDTLHYINEKAKFMDINKKLEDINNDLNKPDIDQETFDKYDKFITMLENQYKVINNDTLNIPESVNQTIINQEINTNENNNTLENGMEDLVDVQAFQQLFEDAPNVQSK